MESNKHVFEGKTTNEAIELGLKNLGVSKNDVEIKVLDGEKRSFFSILAPRIVKVEMTLKNNDTKNEEKNTCEKRVDEPTQDDIDKSIFAISSFLDKWLKTLSVENPNYTVKYEKNLINVNILNEELSYLIGYRGEVMNSLQTVLIAIVDKTVTTHVRVSIDILGYKEKRVKILEDLAEKLAKKVIRTHKMVELEPMNPFERKVIHMKLQDNEYVKTESIGEGNNRRLTIELK